MHIHFLQHEPIENPGYILDWALTNHHSSSATRLYLNEKLPSSNDFDWLIIMGGSMGAYEEKAYPWLKEEKHLIKDAIYQHKSVIGICLGSQLIAEALGARVYPNAEKEIGWFPVRLTDDGRANPIFQGFAEEFQVFHWHGDTFDLPDNAIRLASSDGCRNQAFLYNKNVLALQFHLEVNDDLITNMVDTGREELKPSKYIQPAGEILEKKEFIYPCNLMMARILDRMANHR